MDIWCGRTAGGSLILLYPRSASASKSSYMRDFLRFCFGVMQIENQGCLIHGLQEFLVSDEGDHCVICK